MKRWNGWGNIQTSSLLSAAALDFLRARIGTAAPPQDAAYAAVLAQVPSSRLPAHPLVDQTPEIRLLHARGQSLPDWVALRSGQVGAFPDGVALPVNAEEVRDLLRYAHEVGAKVIPYGGGTSVAGHINPLPGDAPVLTISLARMNDLKGFDDKSGLATFGAGITGPDLEAQLRARGYTLGHYPQSWEYSTLGGWIAARSSGQQSLHYGRIERLFSGGVVETPGDTLRLPDFPASAAGPDLRELVLGSEGRIGIITEATVRASRLPEYEVFTAVMFPDFGRGMDAVRQIASARLPLSLLRLSTATETTTNLALAGHKRLLGALETYLRWRGSSDEKAMLLLAATGQARVASTTLNAALDIAGAQGGVRLTRVFGEQWRKSRFKTPYLRNTLWEQGYAVDTLETAVGWAQVQSMVSGIERAIREALAAFDERVHVFTHLSHVYPYGSSVYTSYAFRLAADPAETLRRWQAMKQAASAAVQRSGGTISHQHGVGLDHAPYLAAEKGASGMAALRALVRHFDPDGMLNPGKLLVG